MAIKRVALTERDELGNIVSKAEHRHDKEHREDGRSNIEKDCWNDPSKKNSAKGSASESSKSSANSSANDSTHGSRVIMGVDPGTNFMGYALIEVYDNPRHELKCLVLGTIRLNKFNDPYKKLSHIFERISSLVLEYRPTEVALEAPFYSTNVQSMLKLGRAQGVAMAAALSHGVDVFEYAPTRIKQSIAGNGRASKEQIYDLLKKLVPSAQFDDNEKLDASDALSVALCHYYNQLSPSSARSDNGAKGEGWKKFINQNPNRVK